jgi:hypothetical protein
LPCSPQSRTERRVSRQSIRAQNRRYALASSSTKDGNSQAVVVCVDGAQRSGANPRRCSYSRSRFDGRGNEGWILRREPGSGGHRHAASRGAAFSVRVMARSGPAHRGHGAPVANSPVPHESSGPIHVGLKPAAVAQVRVALSACSSEVKMRV